MKRLLILLALVSCTRYTPEVATISFNLSNTKSLPTAIASCYPEQMDLRLTNKASGKVTEVKTGESVTLPVGAYSVTGRYVPYKNYVLGTIAYTSTQPDIIVNEEVIIEKGVISYPLSSRVNSWVLAVKSGEVSCWTIGGSKFDFLVDGDSWYVFLSGDLSRKRLEVVLTPTDADHSETSFSLSTNPQEGYYVVPGMYYYLHPAEIPTQEGGLIVQIPEFTEGAV